MSSETKDPYIVKNTPLNYNANDWFYLNKDKCKLQSDGKTYIDSTNKDTTELCNANKQKAMELIDTTNSLDTSRTQYNDAKLLYNRELLFTVNMLGGLALLCYYIYINQSVFPSPAKVMEGAKKATSSMTSMASSAVGNMSIRPPVAK